jgi:hypothetical protein
MTKVVANDNQLHSDWLQMTKFLVVFRIHKIYQSISILMLHVLDHKLVTLIQIIGYMMLVILWYIQFCHMNECIYSTSFVLKQMGCMSF